MLDFNLLMGDIVLLHNGWWVVGHSELNRYGANMVVLHPLTTYKGRFYYISKSESITDNVNDAITEMGYQDALNVHTYFLGTQHTQKHVSA